MIPGFGKIPWRRERLPTPVFWPGEFQGLYMYSPWSQTQLSDFHFQSESDSEFPVTKVKGLGGREPLGGWRALAEGGGTVVRQALGCLKMI